MKTSEDTALALLLALLSLCRDGAAGYETARRDMPDESIRGELERFGKVRAKMVDELKTRIRELRGDPDDAPRSSLAEMHRRWMDVVAGGSGNPVHAVLTEVQRAEDLIVGGYRQALKQRDVDPATKRLLEQHYENAQTAHDRVKQLRDRTAYTLPH